MKQLARKFFSNANPVGKFFRVQPEPGKNAVPIQIVGLVKDSKYESLREEQLSHGVLSDHTSSGARGRASIRTANGGASLGPCSLRAGGCCRCEQNDSPRLLDAGPAG